MKISAKMKESLLKKMAQDPGISLAGLAKSSNVGYSTLCKWRLQLMQGQANPDKSEASDSKRSSRDKFLAVVATKSMNAQEKGEYCRKHGLYVEQLEEWEKACIQANGSAIQIALDLRAELKEEGRKVRELERELARKEKALAEAAALLVLRKKADAIWGVNEED